MFRGFVAKRLTYRFGFRTGNALQALVFGLLHLLLFALSIPMDLLPLALIFLFSTLAGWAVGYIKEKHARGSIVPGWVAHGLGNTIAYFVIAFVL